MNVIQHDVDARIRSAGLVVDHVAKDDTRLGRRDLDGCLDIVECVWAKRMRCGTLDKFEIAEGSEFDGQVLQRIVCLVDDQDVYRSKWSVIGRCGKRTD